MPRHRMIGLLAVCCLLAGCQRPPAAPRTPRQEPARSPTPRVLIIHEGADELAASARALETLIAHFDEPCAVLPASRYRERMLGSYSYVFYLAGQEPTTARTRFAADLEAYRGVATWVGPGVEVLGADRLGGLGLRPGRGRETPTDWQLFYRHRAYSERLAVPPVGAPPRAPVVSEARRGGARHPFLAGRGPLWYAAAAPSLAPEHFWSACIWADALHDILAQPHSERRLLVPALREVPVYVRPEQVTAVLEPVLAAGVPVTVLASCTSGEVVLSDRPPAVEGLRRAESMGATVTLVADRPADPREHLHLAWEVGLHPLAWAGPARGDNPFRLRIAPAEASPPVPAGGILPSPVQVSDAGVISAHDAQRLEMQQVLRDAAAVLTFGLWAPAEPLLAFLARHRQLGWQLADLRELGAVVSDPRRTLVSGAARASLGPQDRLRRTLLGPRWEVEADTTVVPPEDRVMGGAQGAPARSVTIYEPIRTRGQSRFIKGVTLDPWAYSGAGVSAQALAEALAERYSRHGVNTVFMYAYNVSEGAAYRTRYPGATISEWGREDLLGHVLDACHERGIEVVAWLYSGRDRGNWLRHPDWRERRADGTEYNPLRLHATYFLCPRHPGVRRWFAGLVGDLARRYPGLAGVELCEPLVNWWGDQACHCQTCKEGFAIAHPDARVGGEAWRRYRAEGLTEFLSQCMQAIHEAGAEGYLMTITDAWSNGALLSPRRQAEESGFDMEALLAGPHAPDWVNYEVIWQQWAALYSDEVFNPNWAARVAAQLMRRVDGRARVVFHVELTDFGRLRMTPARLAETIGRVSAAQADGIECFHSAALDQKSAWATLKRSYEDLP